MTTQITCPKCGAQYSRDACLPEGADLKCDKCGTSFSSISDAATIVPTPSPIGSPQDSDQSLVGQVIGGCRIEETLGRGGMGTVYKAHHIALDISVAIKVLSPQLASADSTFADRFVREARAAARLQHENILGVLNVGQERGLYFIVMQLIDGETLEERISREHRLGADESVAIMMQVCEALSMAHRNNIVHRDIKPDNIMIDREGTAKLADLGLAKDVEEQEGLTQAGMALGTPYYMAPEQAADAKSADHRSDIYSLGCTLYRMVTGSVPYDGESGFTILTKHANEPVPNPYQINPEIPEALGAVICRMMDKKPDDRYQTVAELRADLERLAAGVSPIGLTHGEGPARWHKVEAGAPAQGRLGRKRRLWLCAGGGVLLMLVVVASLWGERFWLKRLEHDRLERENIARPRGGGGRMAQAGDRGPGRGFGGGPGWGSGPGSGRGRNQGGPRGRRAAEGHRNDAILVGDWRLFGGIPGEGLRRYDLSETEHGFKDGVLTVRNLPDEERTTLRNMAVLLSGDFGVQIDVRGLADCGIIQPGGGGNSLSVRLPAGLVSRGDKDKWRTVRMSRKEGILTCLVDGTPVPQAHMQGDQNARGFLWLGIGDERPAEIRKCLIDAGQPHDMGAENHGNRGPLRKGRQ